MPDVSNIYPSSIIFTISPCLSIICSSSSKCRHNLCPRKPNAAAQFCRLRVGDLTSVQLSLRLRSVLTTMPASKKDLRAAKQKANVKAGIGDASGKLPSQNKDAPVMAGCTICKQQIRMVKKNEQAKVHVDSKHAGKKFEECFPGFTYG